MQKQKQEQCEYAQRDYDRDPAEEDTGSATLLGFGLLCGVLLGLAGFNASADAAELQDPAPAVADLLPDNDTIRFGTIENGALGQRTLILEHTGTSDSEPLVINSVFLDELDEKSFSTDFRGPIKVFPGERYEIDIVFKPGKSGLTVGNLFVNHSGAGGVHLIRLSGQSSIDGPESEIPSGKYPELQSRIAPSFGKSTLSGIGNITPTSLQFGPDGRLYAANMNGQIKVYTVQRNSANQYSVTATETLNQIKNIPNHNDNGTPNNSLGKRLVTGLLVTGSSANPVIYVNSSDPRIGGGASGTSTNLDTNSTVLSRLTKTASGWQKLDLVRGLPRSEENHHANGLAINAAGTKLYIAMGGNTNQGGVSNNFALLPEYALSAAILEVDLNQIGNSTYDLPTLNDEDRAGNNDWNDPFGGNRGKNQAKIVPGGPVKVYAPGFRNPYDVVITQSGKMYSWDNGGNAGWGNVPQGNGPQGVCSNGVSEPGATYYDALHHISGPGYYGGHANPTRGNNNNKFNSSNPQSPVPFSNPVECHFRGASGPGSAKHPLNGSLFDVPSSTNGLTEFTNNNFNGAMQGNLLAAAFDNKIYRVQLNASGTAATNTSVLFSNVGQTPLDVTALGGTDPFPGTIWVSDFAQKSIIVFEPVDYQGNTPTGCNPGPASGDADQDGFTNGDENANNTDPCSAADIPADADGDFISDLIDTDDDNDGIADLVDPFARDEFNGANTPLGTSYDWENNSPVAPFISNLGFSGLMTNGSTNYQNQFDLNQMTISGAAGVVTVDTVSNGDAVNNVNSQENGFQFGVDVDTSSPVFRAHTRIQAPFAGINPSLHQAMGLFIGTGDQDNYIKLVVNSAGPQGGMQFMREVNGLFDSSQSTQDTIFGASAVDLFIEVNPANLTATPYYQITANGNTGTVQTFGNPISFPASWLNGPTKLAVGIISTSFGASPFSATWDLIEVVPVWSGSTNLPPIANAGNDQSVTLPATATLNGNSSDDGLPNGTLTSSWTQLSGPGTVTFAAANSPGTTASFSAAGTYVLQLSATDGQYTQTDDVIVYVSGGGNTGGGNTPANYVSIEVENYNAIISAAPHNWVASTLGGTSGTGSMITTPNNNTIKPGSANSPMLAYQSSFPSSGTYYVWVRGWGDTSATGEGKDDSLHIGLNGVLSPTADKIDQFPAGGWAWTNSTRDSAVATINVPSAGTHTVNLWMREDGLAVDKLELTTDITYMPGGTGASGSNPVNLAPLVNAGSDQATTPGSSVTLNGSASDDGLPGGSTLVTSWTQISGPASALISAPANTTTSATFNAAGSYVLQLNATDGTLTASDTVIVTVSTNTGGQGPNQSPIRINAGGPQVIANGITWIADNPGNHGYVNTGSTYTFGGSVSTAAVAAGIPTALFKTERWDAGSQPEMQWDIPVAAGNYVVKLYFSENYGPAQTVGGRVFDIEIEGNVVASNLDVFATAGAASALMQSYNVSADTNLDIDFKHVTQNPSIKAIEILPGGGTGGGTNPTNLSPVVTAGSASSTAVGTSLILSGSATDDGLPNGTLNTSWSKLSGPGTVTFTNAASVNSAATFSASGSYTLQLSATDTALSASDTVVISVSPGGTNPVNQAPVVNAGSNQAAFTGTSITLNGSATDDGLPSGSSLGSTWTQVSGPGTATFSSPANPVTQVSFTTAGNYSLQLTANDGSLSASDNLMVSVSNNTGGSTQSPIRINAGGPQVTANGITWIADNPGNHGYVNTGKQHTYAGSVATAALPVSVPATLFKTERWDAGAAPEMQWDIPVAAGNYEVRLYFSENYAPTQTIGGRVFDIEIEGTVVSSNLDVFATVGAATALMQSFNVTSDANLDIDFAHVTQNPSIKAIEILPN